MTDKLKKCPICQYSFYQYSDVDILLHFVGDHPTDEKFSDIIRDMSICVKCFRCGSEFDSDVRIGVRESKILRDSVCPDCAEGNISGLYVVETSAKAAIEGEENAKNIPALRRQGDTTESDGEGSA